MEEVTLIYIFGAIASSALLGCLGVLARSLWVDIRTIGPMLKRQNELYGKVDELYSEREENLKKIAALRVEIEGLQEERRKDQDKITALQGEIATLHCDVGKRDTKILELQEQVAALHASLALKEARIRELEAERNRRTGGTEPLTPESL